MRTPSSRVRDCSLASVAGVPELPEVEVLCRRLDERTRHRRVEGLDLASFSALKTFAPPLSSLEGHRIDSVTRHGKFVCVETDGGVLVVHLARSGWVRWREQLGDKVARPGRGPLALRVHLEGGSGFDVTEMATEKRLAVYVAAALGEVEPVASLGIDPLDAAFTTARLAELLEQEKADLKHALSRQSLVAGIGNAYSDEALHAARLSPFKPAARLSVEEVERLHTAIVEVLSDALGRAEACDIDELKDSKRTGMRVHGRTGEACPVCGDVVREVAFANRSLQYCATCQTGGKPLADRRLSRLLK